SLQDSDFLEAPTIRVKATKRRIKVNVKGTLKRTADLIGQTEAWSKTMEERLARLVGTGHKITIDVHFEDIQSMKRPQQQQTQARVE
ncbi:alkaline shock response membrane anchor protein AmaP, partial [Staphylococcus haemolyticus]